MGRDRKREAGSWMGMKERERKRERMALGFFRGRDFETCLSALKSREIKEAPRPKPGEHVRMREDDEEARPRRRERRTGRCRGYTPKDGPTGQERSLAKSSSTFVHAPRFPPRSFVRSSYSPSPRSIRTLLFYRPAVASFNIPSRGMYHTLTLGAIYEIISGLEIHCLYRAISSPLLSLSRSRSRSLHLDHFGCFFDRELIPRAGDSS